MLPTVGSARLEGSGTIELSAVRMFAVTNKPSSGRIGKLPPVVSVSEGFRS